MNNIIQSIKLILLIIDILSFYSNKSKLINYKKYEINRTTEMNRNIYIDFKNLAKMTQ